MWIMIGGGDMGLGSRMSVAYLLYLGSVRLTEDSIGRGF
jgi:hypothetical protein